MDGVTQKRVTYLNYIIHSVSRVVLKLNKLLSKSVVVSSNTLSFREPIGPKEVFSDKFQTI